MPSPDLAPINWLQGANSLGVSSPRKPQVKQLFLRGLFEKPVVPFHSCCHTSDLILLAWICAHVSVILQTAEFGFFIRQPGIVLLPLLLLNYQSALPTAYQQAPGSLAGCESSWPNAHSEMVGPSQDFYRTWWNPIDPWCHLTTSELMPAILSGGHLHLGGAKVQYWTG